MTPDQKFWLSLIAICAVFATINGFIATLA